MLGLAQLKHANHRELSNGHFSDDNQKMLSNSSDLGIPVFEAKMTRDKRLLVDFILT